MEPTMPNKAQAFIDKLLGIIASQDPTRMDEIVGETITFHTPRFLRPHTDRRIVCAILRSIPQVIEGFHYERTWAAGDQALMEFKGHIGKWTVHGLDIFTVADDGRASELTVFIRPPKGLEALGEAEDRLARAHGFAPGAGAPTP
jgi:hypothetical protein